MNRPPQPMLEALYTLHAYPITDLAIADSDVPASHWFLPPEEGTRTLPIVLAITGSGQNLVELTMIISRFRRIAAVVSVPNAPLTGRDPETSTDTYWVYYLVVRIVEEGVTLIRAQLVEYDQSEYAIACWSHAIVPWYSPDEALAGRPQGVL